jgi:anti-sigma B factor antagonist
VSLLAQVEDEFHDGVAVVRVTGEIDASNTPDIGERLRDLLTNRSLALVVDLTEVVYLDSAGINLLLALGEEMRGRQQRLALVVADASPIARMVAITGMDRVLAVHPTAAAALDAVRDDGGATGATAGPVATPD